MDFLKWIFYSGNFNPNCMWYQLGLALRLIVAGVCGAAIGSERSKRLKDAGIRTHVIVALGATLMMLVSKYGFYDQIQQYTDGFLRVDTSRIASQIVTGVGFLGAGMIFHKRGSVKGLTTAAGMWATAGVGMAIGSGMYFIGIFATIVIVLAQLFMHKVLSSIVVAEYIIRVDESLKDPIRFRAEIEKLKIGIESLDLKTKTHEFIEYKVCIKIPENKPNVDVISRIMELNGVESVTSIPIDKEA